MQVAERRNDLDHVGDRLIRRQRSVELLAHLLQRLAADELHHDVANRDPRRIRMLDEVVDLDDVRMLDPRERENLRLGHGHRLGIAGVEQALEHHPAVFDVAVGRQVDPAEAAVRYRALNFVLAADDFTARKLGNKRVSRATLGAEALGAARLPVTLATHRLVAVVVAAVAAALGYLRIGEYRRRRVALRYARHLHNPCAEAAAGTASSRRTGTRRAHRGGASRRDGMPWRGCDGNRLRCFGSRGGAADIAVAVDDGPFA